MSNNMSSTSIQKSNPNGDALYKGVSCPVTIGQYMDFPKMANQLIVENMQQGTSLSAQGDFIIRQMDELVEKLITRVRYSEKNGNKTGTKKIVSSWIKACGVSDSEMLVQWNVNVQTLLKLKRISTNGCLLNYNVPKQSMSSDANR
jgi:hypothetical protein